MSPTESKATAFVGPFLSFCALVLGMAGTFACQFVSIGITVTGLSNSASRGVGIWNYQGNSYYVDGSTIYYSQACYSYGDNISPDANWKAAQAFAIIAAVFGGVACIASCMAPCVEGCVGNKVLAFTFMFVALCQGLCLLFLKSDACGNNPIVDLFPQLDLVSVSCNLSWGANCTIAATVLWFVAGASMCFLGGHESNADDDAEAGGDEEPPEEKDDAPKVNDAAVEE